MTNRDRPSESLRECSCGWCQHLSVYGYKHIVDGAECVQQFNTASLDKPDDLKECEEEPVTLYGLDCSYEFSNLTEKLLYDLDERHREVLRVEIVRRRYDHVLESSTLRLPISWHEEINHALSTAALSREDILSLRNLELSKDELQQYIWNERPPREFIIEYHQPPIICLSKIWSLPFQFLLAICRSMRFVLPVLLVHSSGVQALGDGKINETPPDPLDHPLTLIKVLRGYPFIIVCAGILAMSWATITYAKVKATHVTGAMMFICSMACSISQVDGTTSPVQKWS